MLWIRKIHGLFKGDPWWSEPPDWIKKRHPEMLDLDDNPIFLLMTEYGNRRGRIFRNIPKFIFLCIFNLVILIVCMIFLSILGVFLYLFIATYIQRTIMGKRHELASIFGTSDTHLIRDIYLTGIDSKLVLFGALAKKCNRAKGLAIWVMGLIAYIFVICIISRLEVSIVFIVANLLIAFFVLFIITRYQDGFAVAAHLNRVRECWYNRKGASTLIKISHFTDSGAKSSFGGCFMVIILCFACYVLGGMTSFLWERVTGSKLQGVTAVLAWTTTTHLCLSVLIAYMVSSTFSKTSENISQLRVLYRNLLEHIAINEVEG